MNEKAIKRLCKQLTEPKQTKRIKKNPVGKHRVMHRFVVSAHTHHILALPHTRTRTRTLHRVDSFICVWCLCACMVCHLVACSIPFIPFRHSRSLAQWHYQCSTNHGQNYVIFHLWFRILMRSLCAYAYEYMCGMQCSAMYFIWFVNACVRACGCVQVRVIVTNKQPI